MINTFLTKIPKGNPKIVSVWDRGMGVIDTRFNYILNRISNAQPLSSKGVRLIEHLLSNIPPDYFFTDDNDMNLFIQGLVPMVDGHIMSYDSIRMKKVQTDLFVKNDLMDEIPEVITHMSNSSPLSSLPMNEPFGYWMNVNPIRILNSNSVVLPTNTEGSQMNFGFDEPYLCVFGLNLPVLMMKYIKYKRFKKDIGVNVELAKFVHNELILSLRRDSLRAWLMKIIDIMITGSMSVPEILAYQNSFIVVNNVFKSNLTALEQQIQNVKKGKVQVQDFLATKWLNGMSITEYAASLQSEYVVPDDYRYLLIKFLSEIPIIKPILHLIDMYPAGKSKYSNFLRDIDRKIRKYDNVNIENRVSSASLKYYVKRQLEEFSEILG